MVGDVAGLVDEVRGLLAKSDIKSEKKIKNTQLRENHHYSFTSKR